MNCIYKELPSLANIFIEELRSIYNVNINEKNIKVFLFFKQINNKNLYVCN